MKKTLGIRTLVVRPELVALLIGGLIHTTILAGPAMATLAADRQVGQVRRAVTDIAEGPEARVAVTLKNRSTVSGYVAMAGESSFIVTDPRTGESTQVPYANVRHLSRLSTGAKIAIGAGIGVAAFLYFWVGCVIKDVTCFK